MKVTYQIYVREFTENNEYVFKKYYKIGLKNKFTTMKESVEFITNPENEEFFTLFEEYTILPIFEKQ